MHLKRPTVRHTIIKMAKVKDKENLKSSKRKTGVMYKGAPLILSDGFFNRNISDQKGLV